MSLSVVQMRAFLTVARFRSFTAAANHLHMSQPTLTLQIQQLEKLLKLRLFDRSTRHVYITREGRDLLSLFENLLRQFDATVSQAQRFAEKSHDVIHIGCLPSVASTYLPEVMAQFRKRHPHVSFVIRDAVARRIVHMVRNEDVEIGIIDGDFGGSDLESVELSRDYAQVVFPKSHPIGRLAKVSLEAVLEYPLVLMEPGINLRSVLDKAFAAEGRIAMPVCEVTYISTAVGMVRAGLGLTILSTLSVKSSNLSSMDALQSRRIDSPTLLRRISLIKKVGSPLTPSAEAFERLLLGSASRTSHSK